MKPIDKGDTSMMTGEQFTKSRHHGPQGDVAITVGGSDIATIFGISPWRTKLELWHAKRKAYMEFIGKANDAPQPVFTEEENASAKAAGHLYEPYVGEIFKKKLEEDGHEVALLTDKHTYQCSDWLLDEDGFPVEDDDGNPVLRYPFALANVDGLPLVDGEQVLLECKTTSAHNFETIEKWKKGIVPEYYDLQVRWYMKIMDIDTAYICCAWSLAEGDAAVIRMERDRQLEEEIVRTVEAFVQSVMDNTEPDPDEDNPELLKKYYTKLYGPAAAKQTIDITNEEDAEEFAESLAKIKREIAQTESYLEKLQEKLTRKLNEHAPLYGSYDTVMFSNDKYRLFISVKNKSTRATITEESVAAVDPSLLVYGNGFDVTAFKANIKEKINELRKEARACKKANDIAGMDAKDSEAEKLEKALSDATIPPQWKGIQEITVKFYDPKDTSKQVL